MSEQLQPQQTHEIDQDSHQSISGIAQKALAKTGCTLALLVPSYAVIHTPLANAQESSDTTAEVQPAQTESTEQINNPDFGYFGNTDSYAVRGKYAKFSWRIFGDNLKSMNTQLVSQSKHLRLTHFKSSPDWTRIDGVPTWNFDVNNDASTLSFRMKVARTAKLGSRLCSKIVMTASGEPGSTDMQKSNKSCVKIVKRLPSNRPG